MSHFSKISTLSTHQAAKALLGEYDRALDDLKAVMLDLTSDQLNKVVDSETKDKDCISIQSILTHVVQSGYTYVIAIRRSLGEDIAYKGKVYCESAKAYSDALDAMFQYNIQLFEDYPDLELEAYDAKDKLTTRWGQLYDVEQLLEHAIVHILRHRRQIEQYKKRLAKISF